uniref:Uncharacterized protein n=1 Tax=Rangifer tarandus platyrhynchus TaxID=3082113 RepID=A0ACB0EIE1_RANTA|nr:unnamed protein product [Rangifer tarandus platyrhynchus]
MLFTMGSRCEWVQFVEYRMRKLQHKQVHEARRDLTQVAKLRRPRHEATPPGPRRIKSAACPEVGDQLPSDQGGELGFSGQTQRHHKGPQTCRREDSDLLQEVSVKRRATKPVSPSLCLAPEGPRAREPVTCDRRRQCGEKPPAAARQKPARHALQGRESDAVLCVELKHPPRLSPGDLYGVPGALGLVCSPQNCIRSKCKGLICQESMQQPRSLVERGGERCSFPESFLLLPFTLADQAALPAFGFR